VSLVAPCCAAGVFRCVPPTVGAIVTGAIAHGGV
jgi:hypothetical protein